MNAIAEAQLNSAEYRMQYAEDIDGFHIQRIKTINNERDWVTIARVRDKDLAWRTWSAILIADRAGRM